VIITTKTTDDYSAITFGNTLVVHIDENETPYNKTVYYTATITTSDTLEYTMAGQVFTLPGSETFGAIYGHDMVVCTSTRTASRATLVTTSHDLTSCPSSLGINPDANINQWETTDLLFSVWTTKGELLLDGADVVFDIRSSDGATITTKYTDDYSVVTFGDTLVVHLNAKELLANKTVYYTATITTSDEREYTMTGVIHVSETALDTCFMQDVVFSERSIDIIPVIQRGELREITERTVSTVSCARPSQAIQNTERISDVIRIAPCGKRRR
jgi:hypothetical protein